MEDHHQALRKARRLLVRTYVLHLVWFAIMLCFAGWHWSSNGLKASVLLTLVTVPPVLYYTVRVHHLCRAINPKARTVGWVPVLVTTLVLSPFESGLILPIKNLMAANKLLKGAPASASQSRFRAEGPNKSFKPNPLHGSSAPDGSRLSSASETTRGGSA